MSGEQTVSRRNDIGSKVLVSVVAVLVTIIMGFSISAAQTALGKAHANDTKIGKIETAQVYYQKSMDELRVDIKDIKHAIMKQT